MPDWTSWQTWLYQLPLLLLGWCLRRWVRWDWLWIVLLLPGTLVHELLHLTVGLLFNGRPVGFSVWPRRTGDGGWLLGSVSFENACWYNALFIGLAPLLAPLLLLYVAPLPLPEGWRPRWSDWCYWLLAAPVLSSCLPSGADWRLACRSWPLVLLLLLGWAGSRW